MPATPAWPPASSPRLFVEDALSPGAAIVLDGARANYLVNVMRVAAGGAVRLCDDRTGEWLARVEEAGRRTVRLRVAERLRAREAVPDLWLLFAPLKKDPQAYLVEKATELGVARLQPVVTRRTIVDRVNMERLRAHAVEAAEQCDRTALPETCPPRPLEAVLRDWPADRALLFADEAGGAPIAGIARPGPAALLIGPEGGFHPDERALIRALPAATAISLGPRILRAETAAAAALAVWMSVAGDW